jgi:hypothetical protein
MTLRPKILFSSGSIFIQRARGVGLTASFRTHFFIRITINPAALPHNISRGYYVPRVAVRAFIQLIYQPVNCIRVTIHPKTVPHNIRRGH